MANGSAILLFLSYYADLSSTLSVIRYQLSIFHCPLLISHLSPPQPAGLRNCNAAAFDPF
jgi:hypothetical protein